MILDDARDEAVRLLRDVCRTETSTKRFDDLARQYVTAQACYANMLLEWENIDA